MAYIKAPIPSEVYHLTQQDKSSNLTPVRTQSCHCPDIFRL